MKTEILLKITVKHSEDIVIDSEEIAACIKEMFDGGPYSVKVEEVDG